MAGFDASAWRAVAGFEDLTDVTYHHDTTGRIARVAFNRPEVRNAFRPETIFELQTAFADVRDDPSIGVVLFTGEGPDAFCSGGDQRVRGDDGYVGDDGKGATSTTSPGSASRRRARRRPRSATRSPTASTARCIRSAQP